MWLCQQVLYLNIYVKSQRRCWSKVGKRIGWQVMRELQPEKRFFCSDSQHHCRKCTNFHRPSNVTGTFSPWISSWDEQQQHDNRAAFGTSLQPAACNQIEWVHCYDLIYFVYSDYWDEFNCLTLIKGSGELAWTPCRIGALLWLYCVHQQHQAGEETPTAVHVHGRRLVSRCPDPSFLPPPQNKDNDTLKDLLKASVEKPVKMLVYSSKTLELREATVTPSNLWGGQGLLGVSIRFCSFEGANENVWHVLVRTCSSYSYIYFT